MEEINPSKIYKSIKSGVNRKFKEKKHCEMVIRIMSDTEHGTVSSFCVRAGISDSTFYRWCAEHEIFRECYRYGVMISQCKWDKQGALGMFMEDFNTEVWKVIGSSRFGIGKTNRIRVHVDAETTPYDQYKQLMRQAANGDFTAGEIKQLMESVNIGTRVYEVFELQSQVNQMQEDLRKMELHNGYNSSTTEETPKIN